MPPPKMTRIQAGTPGWYQLTVNGALVAESEDQVALCINARDIGTGALVQEIAHPIHQHAPFGLWASGEGLRRLAGIE